MSVSRLFHAFVLLGLAALTAVVPNPGYAQQHMGRLEVDLGATVSKVTVAPAGSAAFAIPFPIGQATRFGDTIHVTVESAAVGVTLVVPGGATYTCATAQAAQIDCIEGQQPDTSQILTPMQGPGHHVLFMLPAAMPPGSYEIRVNTTAMSEESVAVVQAMLDSDLVLGLEPVVQVAPMGKRLAVLAFLRDGEQPVVGATLTGKLIRASNPASATPAGNTLSTERIADGKTLQKHWLRLTNTGTEALLNLSARVSNQVAGIEVVHGEVHFGVVPPGETVASMDTFEIAFDEGSVPQVGQLTWRIIGSGDPEDLVFLDSGADDAAPGDGVYTAVVLPDSVGTYDVFVEAAGVAPLGGTFHRWAKTSFEARPWFAVLESAAASVADADSDGKTDAVNVTANITVDHAGEYHLRVTVADAGDVEVDVFTTATLAAGTQQMVASFEADRVAEGVLTAPLRIAVVQLNTVYDSQTEVADILEDAGPFPLVPKAALDRGEVYVESLSSATGVDLNGDGLFDSLRIVLQARMPAGACEWEATLFGSDGSEIESGFGYAEFATAGTQSLALSFDGNLVGRAIGAEPLVLRRVELNCDSGERHYDPQSYSIPGLQASQFVNVTASFNLTATPLPVRIVLGVDSAPVVGIHCESLGGFQEYVPLTAGAVPQNVVAEFVGGNECPYNGVLDLKLRQTGALVAGTYETSVTGVWGGVTRAVAIPIEVVDPPRVEFSMQSASLQAAQGSYVDFRGSVGRINNYAGGVALTLTGLPAGATATFLPNATSFTGQLVVRVQTSNETPLGIYSLQLVGTAEGMAIAFPLVLEVSAPAPFTITAMESVAATPPGSSVDVRLNVVYRSDWTGIIVWGTTGLPPGATIVYNPASTWSTEVMRAAISTTAATPAGQYLVSITGSSFHNLSLNRTVRVLLVVDAQAIPDPWLQAGVGASPGLATVANERYSLSGAGERIGGPQDAAQLIYQNVSGNFTMLAQVVSQSAAQGTSMTGLMVRESLDIGAKSFFVGWEGASGSVVTVHRTAAGTESQKVAGPGYETPYWLKIVREGNVFRGFASFDGVQWRGLGQPVTMAMAAGAVAGMAVASDGGSPNVGTFSGPRIASSAGFYVTPAGGGQWQVSRTDTEIEIPVSVVGIQGAVGPYELFVEELPPGVEAQFFPAQMAGAGASSLRLRLFGTVAGEYPFRVAARMGSVYERTALKLRVVENPEPGSLPAGWLAESVGAPGAVGQQATANGETVTLSGSLAAIDSGFDRMEMAFRPMLGGATIRARVQNVTSGSVLAEAGLAIRESMAPDAAFVSLGSAPDGTMKLRYRTATGESVQASAAGSAVTPQWMRLERKSEGIQAAISTDGGTWTPVGNAIPLTLPELCYPGAFAAAGLTGTAVTASFGNVESIRPAPEFQIRVTPELRSVPAGQGIHYFSVQALALYGFDEFVNLSAAGVPEGMRVSFYPPVVGAGATSVMRLDVDATLAAGSYPIEVRGTKDALVKSASVTFTLTATGSPVPLPWAVEYIGGTQGVAPTITGTTMVFGGPGFVPSGTFDDFQYSYRLAEGDMTLTARITAMPWAWWADASLCLMARQSVAPDSPFAAACVKLPYISSTVETSFRTRPKPGYPVTTTTGVIVPMPYWIRLDRRGDTFTARISSDGMNWTAVGEARDVAMPQAAFAGVGYASGHATGSLSTTIQDFGLFSVNGAMPDYLISATPGDYYLAKNRRAYYSVGLDRLNGFSGDVELTVEGAPAGIAASTISAKPALPGIIDWTWDRPPQQEAILW